MRTSRGAAGRDNLLVRALRHIRRSITPPAALAAINGLSGCLIPPVYRSMSCPHSITHQGQKRASPAAANINRLTTPLSLLIGMPSEASHPRLPPAGVTTAKGPLSRYCRKQASHSILKNLYVYKQGCSYLRKELQVAKKKRVS